jgi:prepilin-type N-terminal cleavage/methylation domain-containing protein
MNAEMARRVPAPSRGDSGLLDKTVKARPSRIADRVALSPRERGDAGFSLLELLVATAIFTLIAAAAFSLFNQQQTSALNTNAEAGLSIALRNATSQLQMDLVNGGTGYFQGANIPAWPVGVTLVNNVVSSGSCYNSTTLTYGSNCFDSLNIIAVDTSTPPIHPDGSGSNCSSTTSSIAFGDPATGQTAAQTASYFHSGDEVLFLSASGGSLDAVVLTQNGQVTGNKIQLEHNPTGGDGTNATDPLGITTHANNKLGTQFCTSDWILRLAPITYSVDISTPSDPKLTRTVGLSGTPATVMDQVIGFKVGATIWNSGLDTVSTQYYYDASQYGNVTAGDQAYNFTLVRSVRISLIGRTAPSSNPAYTFRNSFDSGAYQVQGMAIVVNPRNMSMND